MLKCNIFWCNVFSCPLFAAHVSARVSSKIQQLLNTLKRPKRKPLQDFFVEEDDELEGEFDFFIGRGEGCKGVWTFGRGLFCMIEVLRQELIAVYELM